MSNPPFTNDLFALLSDSRYSDRFTVRVEIQSGLYQELTVPEYEQPQQVLTELTVRYLAVDPQGQQVDSCIFKVPLTVDFMPNTGAAKNSFTPYTQLTIEQIVQWPGVLSHMSTVLAPWQATVYQRLTQEEQARQIPPSLPLNLISD